MLYFKKALPSVVTTVGLLMGLAGLLTQNLYLMLGSLGLDVVDGYVARALETTSAFGAELDWHVDAALAVAALMFFDVPWAIVPLVFLQATTKEVNASSFTQGKLRVTATSMASTSVSLRVYPPRHQRP